MNATAAYVFVPRPGVPGYRRGGCGAGKSQALRKEVEEPK